MKKLLNLVDVKLLKFFLVGVTNTAVGWIIMFGLHNAFGVQETVASAANYILTSILSYFLNKYFTFQYKKRSFSVVVRFVVNICVCYLIAYGAAKPLVRHLLQGLLPLPARNGPFYKEMY